MPTVHEFSLAEEHRFWLKIMEEHARFLVSHLGAEEHQWREEALAYLTAFHSLQTRLEMLRLLPEQPAASAPGWVVFAKNAYSTTAGYYKLEGKLQALRLAGEIELGLTPEFLNSTLTESQEYLRLLKYYVQGVDAPDLPLWDLMELWLPDQLNHAELLIERLKARVEPLPLPDASLLDRIGETADRFRACLIGNRSVHGFLRFTPSGYPGQLQLAAETAAAVLELYRLFQLAWDATDSTAKPFLQHQMAEASYFMRKLSVWVPGAPVRQWPGGQ